MPADALAYQGSFNLLNPTVNLRGHQWGHGYVPEAMQGIINHISKTRKIRAIEVQFAAENHKSQRVMENIDISDDPPSEYIGRYKEKLGEEGYKIACEQNALPENFETLEYNDFLAKRRVLMSETVKKAFKELCK